MYIASSRTKAAVNDTVVNTLHRIVRAELRREDLLDRLVE